MFFSTLYTMLPHHLIKEKLIDLINQMFIRENIQYLPCNKECAFSLLMDTRITIYGLVKKSVMPLGNIFIRFGTILYRQTFGIPMGTNCAPLVADLFLLL